MEAAAFPSGGVADDLIPLEVGRAAVVGQGLIDENAATVTAGGVAQHLVAVEPAPSGTFTNCTGGESAFGGGGGSASGTFSKCTGGDHAYGGGWLGTASGTFTNCTGGYRAFAGSSGEANGGFFRYCTGGVGSFPTYGSPEPVILYCIEDGAEYTP
jgi:hypothetical protein